MHVGVQTSVRSCRHQCGDTSQTAVCTQCNEHSPSLNVCPPHLSQWCPPTPHISMSAQSTYPSVPFHPICVVPTPPVSMQVRNEGMLTHRTRLAFVTAGVLLRRLLSDPDLEVRAVDMSLLQFGGRWKRCRGMFQSLPEPDLEVRGGWGMGQGGAASWVLVSLSAS